MSARSVTSAMLLVAVGGVAAFPTVADAAARPAWSCSDAHSGTSQRQDLDGDGVSDLVVGVPAARRGAGAVDVHYGCRSLEPQNVGESFFDGLPAATPSDAFGSAVSSGHFPLSGSSDARYVAIGAPGADGGRGAVVIAMATAHGLARAGAIRLTGQSVGEGFGSSIASDDNDLWIAAPDRRVDGESGAGAIDHYHLDSSGASFVETLTENTPGIPGIAETDDHFGHVLAPVFGTLMVGEPSEDVGSVKDAGSVTFIGLGANDRLAKARTITQNSPGVSGTAEAGDHFGSSVSGMYSYGFAVGVPGENLGTVANAGAVQFFRGDVQGGITQAAVISQNAPGIPGVAEAGDRFGATALVGDFDGQLSKGGFGNVDVAIGSPGEDLGSVSNAGDITIVKITGDDDVRYVAPILRRGGKGDADLFGSPSRNEYVGSALSALALPVGYNPPSVNGGASLVVPIGNTDLGPAHINAGEVVVRAFDSLAAHIDSGGIAAGERYGVGDVSNSNDIFANDSGDGG